MSEKQPAPAEVTEQLDFSALKETEAEVAAKAYERFASDEKLTRKEKKQINGEILDLDVRLTFLRGMRDSGEKVRVNGRFATPEQWLEAHVNSVPDEERARLAEEAKNAGNIMLADMLLQKINAEPFVPGDEIEPPVEGEPSPKLPEVPEVPEDPEVPKVPEITDEPETPDEVPERPTDAQLEDLSRWDLGKLKELAMEFGAKGDRAMLETIVDAYAHRLDRYFEYDQSPEGPSKMTRENMAENVEQWRGIILGYLNEAEAKLLDGSKLEINPEFTEKLKDVNIQGLEDLAKNYVEQGWMGEVYAIVKELESRLQTFIDKNGWSAEKVAEAREEFLRAIGLFGEEGDGSGSDETGGEETGDEIGDETGTETKKEETEKTAFFTRAKNWLSNSGWKIKMLGAKLMALPGRAFARANETLKNKEGNDYSKAKLLAVGALAIGTLYYLNRKGIDFPWEEDGKASNKGTGNTGEGLIDGSETGIDAGNAGGGEGVIPIEPDNTGGGEGTPLPIEEEPAEGGGEAVVPIPVGGEIDPTVVGEAATIRSGDGFNSVIERIAKANGIEQVPEGGYGGVYLDLRDQLTDAIPNYFPGVDGYDGISGGAIGERVPQELIDKILENVQSKISQ